MLTVTIFPLMRKIAFGGRKPAMEKSISDFPPLPFFRSLFLSHFIYTFSENPKVASPIRVGPTDLFYLFIRLLFGKYGNGFASEKVGPIMLIFPSNKALAEN